MPHRIVNPTKEQVRAYMMAREQARKPPPPPEEIRRQLGWRLEAPAEHYWGKAPAEQFSLVQFYLIPTHCGQVVVQVAVEWWFSRARQFWLIPQKMKQDFKILQ